MDRCCRRDRIGRSFATEVVDDWKAGDAFGRVSVAKECGLDNFQSHDGPWKEEDLAVAPKPRRVVMTCVNVLG
jgi:hypothetical protein